VTLARAASCALALATILPSPVLAHRIAYPKKDTLAIEPGRLVLSLTYQVEDDVVELRRRFDRNTDGTIDQDEAGALEQHLVREARRSLALTIDGKGPEFTVTSVSSRGLAGPCGDLEHAEVLAVLEVRGSPPAAGGTVELSDRVGTGQRRVPVGIEVSDFAVETSAGSLTSEGGRTVVKDAFVDGRAPLRLTLKERR
jgi:hypothetical protein